jgi:hypothetical protein
MIAFADHPPVDPIADSSAEAEGRLDQPSCRLSRV